jgi:peptide/nickel transport system substrate-binding protein
MMGNKIVFTLLLALLLALSSCSLLSGLEQGVTLPDIEVLPGDTEDLPGAPNPRLGLPRAVNHEGDNVLRLPMRHPATLNPLLNRDETVDRVLGLLFEPLAVLDADKRPVGHLADLAFTLDFTGVVITIKNDAIWSDGLPVSSDDFIFSVDMINRAPADAIYKRRVKNIATITRVDERTVSLTFVNATPAAGYALLFPLIPHHYYRNEFIPSSHRNMKPLGNGPYLFESMTPMQSMTMVRNPNTFRRRPAIERVEVLFLPDAQIERYAFDNGLVDALCLPFHEWARNAAAKEVHAAEFPAMHFEFIGFNFTRNIFQYANVRQGIAHAFNADEAVASLYLHHAVRAAAPVHPLGWMHDPDVRGMAYDLERARVLLRSVPRNEPLVIIVGEESPERVAIARRLGLGLQALDFDVEVAVLAGPDFLARLEDDDYDLYVGWMALSFAPDFAFLFGGERVGGVLFGHDAELEGLYFAQQVAVTESAYLQALSQLQHAFAERLPVLGLAFRHSSVLTGKRVQIGNPPAPCNIFLYANEWRIVTE